MIEPDMSYWNTNQVKNVLKRWGALESLIYKCNLTHSINENEFKQYQTAKALFYRLTYLSTENKNIVGYIYCHDDVIDIPSNEEIMDHFGFSKAQLTRILRIIYYDLSQPRKERHAKPKNRNSVKASAT